MLSFQRYMFKDTLRGLLLIIVTLSVLSLLAQGLAYTEVIRENQQSTAVYLKIVGLGAPKVLGLLLPIALFVASLWSLNRIQKDAEIMVVQATGMTHWQVASPLMRLGVLMMILHLGLNLWAQPAAQRELRETLVDARTDLASSLIRPGQFTNRGALTLYARDRNGADLEGVFISDATDPGAVADYLAQTARFVEAEGKPAFLMANAQIHQKDSAGELSIIELEQYKYDLAPFLTAETDIVLKASDRFLPELIWLDETNYVDAQSRDQFTAEVHNRLSTPLLNIAMILLAVWAILGGDYSKLGYANRIARASVFAVLLIVLHIVSHSESKNDPMVNIAQWLLPFGTIIFLSFKHFVQSKAGQKRKLKRKRKSLRSEPS